MTSLELLHQQLTAEIPAAYVSYVKSGPMEFLIEQGSDPKTLLVLNLELEYLEQSEEHRRRFFINGDGCGNYFFVNSDINEEKVMLWSHDPIEIVDLELTLSSYLPEVVQHSRIDVPVERGQLYICRTKNFCESILDPIRLEEWVSAVKETSGIEYLGYREATNPFTGATDRSDAPGFSVILAANKKEPVHYIYGRIILSDTLANRSIANTLAEKLDANLISS